MTSQIVEILNDILTNTDYVNWAEVNLLEEELLDSIEMVELIDRLEEVFGINISPTELEAKNFQSVMAIEQLVRKKLI